jgi:KTSC domain
VTPAVRAGAQAVKDIATPENIATAVGGTAGAAVGHLVGEPVGAGIAGATAGRAFGKAFSKRLAAGAPKSEIPTSPATPPAADLEGVTSPQTEFAASTPPEAVTEETGPAPSTQAPKPPTKAAADLMQQLNDALGGKPLQKGIPLRNQGKAASLPEGFTPVNSTALKGYKYDPATQEFDAITNDGARYRHGEVTPEQFQAFEQAKSKGTAWSELRNAPGVTPLGKVDITGKLQPRIKPQPRTVVLDPTTNRPEFSDVVSAKTGIPEEDLEDLLTQSLKQARAQKAARATP